MDTAGLSGRLLEHSCGTVRGTALADTTGSKLENNGMFAANIQY